MVARAVVVVSLVVALASVAQAHSYCEDGSILVPGMSGGTATSLESLAPRSLPNGVFYYRVEGATPGDSFTIHADDGQEPFVVGLADECPGPNWSPQGLVSGDDSPDEVWLACSNHPDFDVHFVCGAHENGPGDESGTVPDCELIVTLFFGDPGEGFMYCES